MAYKKMTESEMTGLGVSSAGNILTGTAEQNKRIFDNLPIAIGKNLNGVIDELEKKADGDEVWSAVNVKADKTEVAALEEEVAKKADKAEVDKELAKKADTTDVYDKTEVDEKLETENLLPGMSEISEDSVLVGYPESVEGRQVGMSIDLIQPVKGGTYSAYQGGSCGTDYIAFRVDGDITEIPAGSVIIIDSQEYTLITNLTLSDANTLNIRQNLWPAVSGDIYEGDVTFIIPDKPIGEIEVVWNDETEAPDVLPAGTVFDFYLGTTHKLLEDAPVSETEGCYIINRTTQLSPSINAYTAMGPDGIPVILPDTVKPACRWEKLSRIGGGSGGGGSSLPDTSGLEEESELVYNIPVRYSAVWFDTWGKAYDGITLLHHYGICFEGENLPEVLPAGTTLTYSPCSREYLEPGNPDSECMITVSTVPITKTLKADVSMWGVGINSEGQTAYIFESSDLFAEESGELEEIHNSVVITTPSYVSWKTRVTPVDVDEKIAEAGVNVDLSDYYTASQVDTAIQTAIGDVLGGAS